MTQQQQLNPSQALANLNEVAQKYHGTRQDHILLEQSIQTLVGALNKLAELEAKSAEESKAEAESKEPAKKAK